MNSILDDLFIDPEALRQANEQHDAEMRRLGISIKNPGRVGSGWKPQSMIVKGKLTEKKIAKYEELGYYSDEFREFRRKRMQKREGAFVKRDGRMIYSPL